MVGLTIWNIDIGSSSSRTARVFGRAMTNASTIPAAEIASVKARIKRYVVSICQPACSPTHKTSAWGR